MLGRAIKIGHHPDYFLFALICLLTIGGLVILASASSDLGKLRFNDAYYYLKHQLIYGLSIGILGFILGIKINYQFYKRIALVLLLINLALLALVFGPMGESIGGASRWLTIGLLTFQPAELLKLTFILYLAAWLSNPRVNRTQNIWEGLLPFFVICGTIGGMLLFQPATTTFIILIAAGMIVYFLSGVSIRYVFITGILGALTVGLVIYSTPYRWQRIMNYIRPTEDTRGANYQINQALITIGSGGLWGMGYGESVSKATTLPTPTDDAIFAVAAQELGFAGASTLVVLFGILVFRMLWLAKNLRDRFGQLILVGFASIIALQSLINMGAISGLFPLTGVPLPFVSYGGTALAVFLTMSGITLNASKYT